MTGSRKRVFTSEVRKRSRKAASGKGAAAAGFADDGVLARHYEVMGAINGLKELVSGISNIDNAVVSDLKREIQDSTRLRQELESLANAIMETKKEIAALRHPGASPSDDRIVSMGLQLDAVVEATESATNNILAAAEIIDDHASAMRIQASGNNEIAQIEEISEQVTKIFEACNFQDITGQRINKVVNTLKFIEDRVSMMMDILGGSAAFEDISMPEEVKMDEDEKLLNGPQLDSEQKIDQSEIDALFD